MIPEPANSPIVPAELTDPSTPSAVISPPKRESFVTSATAAAVPSGSLAEVVTDVDSADAIEPSSG